MRNLSAHGKQVLAAASSCPQHSEPDSEPAQRHRPATPSRAIAHVHNCIGHRLSPSFEGEYQIQNSGTDPPSSRLANNPRIVPLVTFETVRMLPSRNTN